MVFSNTPQKFRMPARVLAISLALGFLGACKSMPELYDDSPQLSVTERHRIDVNRGDVTLKLWPGRRNRRLSASERDEIASFVARYRSSATGVLTVARPVGSANQIAAAATTARVKRHLAHQGIARRSVATTTYFAGKKRPDAPIFLSFSQYYAQVTKPCGAWPGNLSRTYDNRAYANFGCAQSHNLAAMVANPRDFKTPRHLAPADTARRGVVLDKYRKGEVTTSQRSPDGNGTVSTVAK